MVDVTRETIVSLIEVARRLNVTVQTVRNWADRQVAPQLETAKFGGKVVTSWEAVQRFGRRGSGGASAKLANSPRTPGGSVHKQNHAARKYLEEIGLK